MKAFSIIFFSITVLWLYWLLGYGAIASKLKASFNRKYNKIKALTYFVLLRHFVGFGLFGVLPLLHLDFLNKNLSEFGLNTLAVTDLYWVLGFLVLAILIQYSASKKPENLKQYPYIRTYDWPFKRYFFNTAAWVFYLFGYEILFRGYLFFGLNSSLGFFGSTLVNTMLYALSHWPKGKKEVILSVPFGVFLCWLTFKTGNIWAAFGIHLSLALTNEFYSIYYFKKGYSLQNGMEENK